MKHIIETSDAAKEITQTTVFPTKIKKLMDDRKKAESQFERKLIELQLKKFDPEYFAYLEIEKLLGEITALDA